MNRRAEIVVRWPFTAISVILKRGTNATSISGHKLPVSGQEQVRSTALNSESPVAFRFRFE